MPGKVVQLEHIITPDQMALKIAERYWTWETLREEKKAEWAEVRKYIYAVDTRKTTNSKLPWKNSTTLPKLCQIRDNLYANYLKSLFPKRRWLEWEGSDPESADPGKKRNIENYMRWVVDRSGFKEIVAKMLLDWIDTGNVIGTVDWVDETQILEDGSTKVGYVGPTAVRLSPLDIVFDPLATTFRRTPKVVRSFVSLGELKEMLTRESTPENEVELQGLWDYLKDLRFRANNMTGTIKEKDEFFNIDGFDSFQAYLQGDYAEVLTFYGDMYDLDNDVFYRNHIITIVDRHRIISKRPNPSFFGYTPIFHCGWRPRQDNLWSMGPLDNLVGMQYRIDHVENIKADVYDLVTFPVLKIKGLVDDFEWGPMARIQVSEEGDVDMVAPDVNILQANVEIQAYELKMEEMAGSPREAMGFRSPGEKTAYEVQRLENAASRIYLARLEQFSVFIEDLLQAMLELSRRRMNTTQIRIEDEEFNTADFLTLSAIDVTGNGRLRPVAVSHFAEKAEKIQNATAFFNSSVGMDPAVNVHFSGIETAKMFSDLLDLEGYNLVTPFIRVTENADAQRLGNSQQEQVMMEAGTPAGLVADDVG